MSKESLIEDIYERVSKYTGIYETGSNKQMKRSLWLHDVLQALGDVSVTDKTLVSFIYTSWNLKEPLHLQSKETVDELYNMIFI